MSFKKYKIAEKKAFKKGYRFEQVLMHYNFLHLKDIWSFKGYEFYVKKDNIYIERDSDEFISSVLKRLK